MCERESESDVYICIYIHTHVIYLDPAGGLYQSTKIKRLPCRLRARGTRGEGVLLHLSCPALSGCAQAPIYSRHQSLKASYTSRLRPHAYVFSTSKRDLLIQDAPKQLYTHMHVYEYRYVYMCMCGLHIPYTYKNIYIYMHIYIWHT